MESFQITQRQKGIDLFGGIVMFQENGSVIIWVAVVVTEYRQVLVIACLLCNHTPRAYLYPSHRHALIRLFLVVLQCPGILLAVEVVQNIVHLLTDCGDVGQGLVAEACDGAVRQLLPDALEIASASVKSCCSPLANVTRPITAACSARFCRWTRRSKAVRYA